VSSATLKAPRPGKRDALRTYFWFILHRCLGIKVNDLPEEFVGKHASSDAILHGIREGRAATRFTIRHPKAGSNHLRNGPKSPPKIRGISQADGFGLIGFRR